MTNTHIDKEARTVVISDELRNVSDKAIVSLDARKNEDIDEWARKLAEEASRATD